MNRTALLLATTISVLLATPRVYAQAQGTPPPLIDYQGVVLDSAGAPLAPDVSGAPAPINYAMEFKIWDASSGGNLVWAEKQNVTVSNGKFSIQLGKGTAIVGLTTQVPQDQIQNAFVGSNRFLGVAVTIPPATSGTEIVPRLQFLSSPYSLVAGKAVTSEALNQTVGTATMTNASVTNATIANATIANATITTGVTGSGAGLTSLNATNISSGTVADARLTSNVALLNKAQTFTASNTFAEGIVLYNNKDVDLTGTLFPSGRSYFGLGYYSGTAGRTFAGIAVSGPVLYGATGGMLGVSGNTTQIQALRWFSDGHLGIPNTNYLEFGYDAAKGANTDSRIGFNVFGGDALEIVGGGGGSQSGGANRRIVIHAQGGTRFNGSVTMNGSPIVTSSGSIYASNANDYPIYAFGDPSGQIRLYNMYNQSTSWLIGTDGNTHLAFGTPGGQGGYINRNNGQYVSQSDGRLKKDITEVTGVLDKVLQLKAVSYRFKVNSEDTQKTLGFVAQDVEPLFPEVVEENNGYKSMAYSELVPVAIQAIKEEHERNSLIDRQKDEEIAKLKEQNANLERRLKAIEEKLAR